MKNSASAQEKFSKRTIIAPDRSTTRSEPRTARCTYSPIRSSLPKQKNDWSQNQKRCPEAPFLIRRQKVRRLPTALLPVTVLLRTGPLPDHSQLPGRSVLLHPC